MSNEKLKQWLKPQVKSLERAVNNAPTVLLKNAYQQELDEITAYIAALKK